MAYMTPQIKFGEKAVYEPGAFYKGCIEQQWPVDWVHQANRFKITNGAEPGRGHLLMIRKDVEELLNEQNTENHRGFKLEFKNSSEDEWLAIPEGELGENNQGLYILSARRLGGGKGGGITLDENSMMLVEIVDARFVINKFPYVGYRRNLVKCFHWNADEEKYEPTLLYPTVEGGVTWTEFIEQLWGNLGLGTYPGLPDDVDTTDDPRNFRFEGEGALTCLEQALNHLSCTLVYDPFHPEYKFQIHQIGTDRLGVTIDSIRGEHGQPLFSSETLVADVAIPRAIRFHFPVFAVSAQSDNLAFGRRYATIVKTAASVGFTSVQSHQHHFAQVFDHNYAIYENTLGDASTPINQDDLDAYAEARAAEIYAALIDRDSLTLQFSGAKKISPSGYVETVEWTCLAGDGVKTTLHTPKRPDKLPGIRPPQTPPGLRLVLVELETDLKQGGTAEGWVLVDLNGNAHDSLPADSNRLANFKVTVNGRYFNGMSFGVDSDKENNRGDVVTCLIMPETLQIEGAGEHTLYAIGNGRTAVNGTVSSVDEEDESAFIDVEFPLGDAREITVFARIPSGAVSDGDEVELVWNGLHKIWDVVVSGGGSVEGYLTENLTAGGNAEMRIYETNSGGSLVATDRYVTVIDKAGWSAPSGKYIIATKINGQYRPIVIGC